MKLSKGEVMLTKAIAERGKAGPSKDQDSQG